jgi:cell division protein FtsL
VANKINIALLVTLVVSALGLINSQHEARRLYVEMERAASHSRQLETDWNHLRVEQSALATAAIIDSKARRDLQLESPNARQVWHLVVDPDTRQVQVAVPAPATGARPPATNRATPRPPSPATVPPQSPNPSMLRPLAGDDDHRLGGQQDQLNSPGFRRASAEQPDALRPRPVGAPLSGLPAAAGEP